MRIGVKDLQIDVGIDAGDLRGSGQIAGEIFAFSPGLPSSVESAEVGTGEFAQKIRSRLVRDLRAGELLANSFQSGDRVRGGPA